MGPRPRPPPRPLQPRPRPPPRLLCMHMAPRTVTNAQRVTLQLGVSRRAKKPPPTWVKYITRQIRGQITLGDAFSAQQHPALTQVIFISIPKEVLLSRIAAKCAPPRLLCTHMAPRTVTN